MGELRVIGVGLPRTGTATLAAALDVLGYRCLHQVAETWTWLHSHEEIMGDIGPRQMLAPDGYDAGTEALYVTRFVDAHPDADVVLTVREPAAWFASVSRHADRIHARRAMRSEREIGDADLYHARLFGSAIPNETLWLYAYERHCEAVRQHCERRERRLLEWDATRGEWGGLPEFVGREKPDTPLPWRNRAKWEPVG